MAEIISCTHCGAKLKMANPRPGKKVRCPKCSQPFTIPSDEEEENNSSQSRSRLQEDDENARSRKKRRDNEEDVDSPRRKKKKLRQSEKDEDEERPLKKKKKKSSSNRGLIIGLVSGGIIFLLLVVILFIIFGFGSGSRVPNSSNLPVQKGPPGSPEEVEFAARIQTKIGMKLDEAIAFLGPGNSMQAGEIDNLIPWSGKIKGPDPRQVLKDKGKNFHQWYFRGQQIIVGLDGNIIRAVVLLDKKERSWWVNF